MRLLNRITVKWLVRVLGAVIIFLGLYLAVFFFPYPLFPHHMEAAGFKIYSDRKIPESFIHVFEDARRRAQAMPLYRADALPRIFIIHSQSRFKLLVDLAGKRHTGQGLLISVAGNAFFSGQGIEAISLRNQNRPAHSRLEGSWSAAVAHEVAHHIVFTEIGFREMQRMPVWKSEGYADYTANISGFSSDPIHEIHDQITLLFDVSAWRGPSGMIDRRHFRWQVMVEFLCEVEGIDLARLLDEDVTEARTWAELIARLS